MARSFKAIVYTPHAEEWTGENVYLIKPDDFIRDFPNWCRYVKALVLKRKADFFVVDEADLLFRSHFDSCPAFRDLVINHRHYGLGIAAVTRRVQDIPAKFYGMFEFLALFHIEAPQVVELLERYFEGLGRTVFNLNFERHEFALKEIGKAPRVMVV